MYEAWIEERAGDLVAAERALRVGLDELEGSDERAFSATITGYIAQFLYEQGHHDEAYELCATVRELSPPEDAVNYIYADGIEGAVLTRRGDLERGRSLLLAALERADRSDFFFCRAETRIWIAEAHTAAGDADAGRSYALEALDIYAAKGDVAGRERAREKLAAVGIDVT